MEPCGDDQARPGFSNVGTQAVASPEGDGFDDRVLASHKISITPLQCDTTHHDFRDELSRWLGDDGKSPS